MLIDTISKTGFPLNLRSPQLTERFEAHNEAVSALIPQHQLLVYEVKDGWKPLCEFLNVPAHWNAFPRTNNREEFWQLISGKE
jgi:hypothetical protein